MKTDLYRPLKGGEMIQVGDEYDGCNDPWRDDAKWLPVTADSPIVGQPAPDPRFPAHTRFRRRYGAMTISEPVEKLSTGRVNDERA